MLLLLLPLLLLLLLLLPPGVHCCMRVSAYRVLPRVTCAACGHA